MHLQIVTATLMSTLLTNVIAAPPSRPWDDCQSACMTAEDARQVAINFQSLITKYSDALADVSLTPDFIDYSDSVTELINGGCTGPQPLGAPTFDSRESFKRGQGSQPSIPFEILNVWSNCEAVTIRWQSAQTPELITGIIVLEAVPAPVGNEYPWIIDTVYSEFNSGAWLVNLGVFQPSNCSAPA